uniref:Transposase n=1 Tax=Heterorhabditis bacteriophora TaxID=37862 RepID=A0A1I7W8S1_HETBA
MHLDDKFGSLRAIRGVCLKPLKSQGLCLSAQLPPLLREKCGAWLDVPGANVQPCPTPLPKERRQLSAETKALALQRLKANAPAQ